VEIVKIDNELIQNINTKDEYSSAKKTIWVFLIKTQIKLELKI
jgi:hypothetical protein